MPNIPAMVSFHEPVKVSRFQHSYKANKDIPIDISSVFLEDYSIVQVHVYFGSTPETQEFRVTTAISGVWGGAMGLKKRPGDHPTIKFTPPVPGYYKVVVVGTTPATAGPPPRPFNISAWKSEPLLVEA